MDTERANHKEAKRSKRRANLLERYLPKNTIGAEIGVFWAHISERIVEQFDPKMLFLVDPWDKLFGETYPNCGDYTVGGTLKTSVAKQAAQDLADRHPDKVEVVVDYGAKLLAGLPAGCLEWVYLDAEHTYEPVLAGLKAIGPKLKPDGLILGDDYYLNPNATHKGVRRAVNEFAYGSG
jgi:hypothetical protein